ncbi:MAG: hypothetical protein IPL59_05730 [Candidatus Competibacteraceae bacterium]|nr:hypothetical protein [Candidatus Competibacteraceae bacterium]
MLQCSMALVDSMVLMLLILEAVRRAWSGKIGPWEGKASIPYCPDRPMLALLSGCGAGAASVRSGLALAVWRRGMGKLPINFILDSHDP